MGEASVFRRMASSTPSVPENLQELHRIREQMTKDYRRLSTRAFVERTNQEADAILKRRKLHLKTRLATWSTRQDSPDC